MTTKTTLAALALALAAAACTSTDAGGPKSPAPEGAPTAAPGGSAMPSDAPPPQADVAPPAAAPPPPGPDKGNITGTVTVTPPNLGKHVVVYLKDGPKDAAKVVDASVDQKSMQFVPFFTVIAQGAKVTFLNNDPFPHNVFSPDGEKFDIGTAPQGQARHKVFDKTGPYTMLCNLHPNMLAYVFVSPSTFYAKADAQGKFTFAGVPNGTYTVAAWAPRLAEQTQSVTVAGADVSVAIALHR